MHLVQVRHFARRRALPSLLVIALLIGLLASPALSTTGQAEPLAGIVSVDPSLREISVGAQGTVDIRSDGLSNIYGVQFTVTFDTAYLQVVDGDGNSGNGVQIFEGTCPAPDFVATNAADNVAGTVNYAATQLSPTPACSGGVIATIEFLCLETGAVDPVTVPITIIESIVSDPDGIPLDHTVQHGEIRCIPGFQIVGSAVPQGHPADAAGVVVCLDGTECKTVESDGSFSFVASDAEAHTVTANYRHHLSAEITGITGSPSDVVNLGETSLRAGDLNEDGVVNILDLVMVGGNFGKSEPQDW